MKRWLREHCGVAIAFCVWWALAVLLGMAAYTFWPPHAGKSYTAGLELEPQNVPGAIIGFLAALYAFRNATRPEAIKRPVQAGAAFGPQIAEDRRTYVFCEGTE